jgi:hypothetical protein
VLVSRDTFGSCLRRAAATLSTSAPVRSEIFTPSTPSGWMPVNGMRSSRSSVR